MIHADYSWFPPNRQQSVVATPRQSVGFFARGPRSGEAWLRSQDSDGRPFRRRRLRGERPPASGGQSAAADQGVVRLIRVGSGSMNDKDIHDIIEKLLDDKTCRGKVMPNV